MKATWFDGLDEATRERVFTQMRDMRAKSDKYLGLAQQFIPQFGEISIGGGREVDERVIGEGIARYLSALVDGPEKAWIVSVEIMELIIGKHNHQCGKNYHERRYELAGQDTVMHLHRQILQTVEEAS